MSSAVSVMPAIQVATAMRKVVVPSVEWTGTMADLREIQIIDKYLDT